MTFHVETRGSGPDLVLLHGWGLHSGAWADVLPALAEKWRVHAIDLPGHGRSASIGPGSFEETSGRIAAHVPKGATVCGWSLGGLIAQHLARHHAERVSRLVLVATTPCFAARAGWAHGMSQAALATFTEGLENDRETMLKRFVALNALHGPQGREAVRTFTARLADHGPPSDAGLAITLSWLRDIDLREQTRGLAIPTAIVHGSRDMVVPMAAARWLAQSMPNATLHEIPKAAHMPFYSHRAEFLAALEELAVA
jgi:pimeloyl-[acyl-carrier protein] methyl ester esterase